MVTNTRHTGIVVKDINKAVSFYEGMGMVLVKRMVEEGPYIEKLVGLPNARLEWAKLRLPDQSLLELLQYHSHPETGTDALQESYRLGCSHIAFTVIDIEKAIAYVTANGGKIKSDYQFSLDGKVKVIYCYDLEGNILELVQVIK
jgi:catechol 2,3-dioxygenase-like lactoylglutathione lyase family enzyme